ncbi:MAG: hypothetical protein HYS62_00280 [Candidatus Aenigmarchaeota archaeon]|nr:hypothetical protein [Candidatus Aenigmarchaeota archaeon]
MTSVMQDFVVLQVKIPLEGYHHSKELRLVPVKDEEIHDNLIFVQDKSR